MTYSSANSDSAGQRTDFVLGENLSRRATTAIGADTTLKGHVTSEEEILVSGTADGELTSATRVVIEPGGTAKGLVTAPEIVVSGKVFGDLHASAKVQVTSAAEVRGDITTPSLAMEPGATFVGRCFMTPSTPTAAR